ncbi:MFS transporter [Bacillus mangrovi]|uniref:MFS transporter n=1 Tax=Metabacillus mangrovi TaxID=1491830 RepID=A0A7X2S235_9BACI|nr:MFS transporter [Metabacillus mangrovi]MTH52279.1 MFS transporter [Metabacillus mangrovi]
MGERAVIEAKDLPVLKKNQAAHKILAGNSISFIGDQIYVIAIPLLVLSLTGSPLYMGAAAAAERLPVLLQPAAGVLADRIERRRILLLCDLGRAAVTGLLGVLSVFGLLELWMLFLGAFLTGCMSQLYQTAQFAYIPGLVRKEDLPAVNSVNSAIMNSASLMAPATGGLIISLYSPAAGLLINSASFFLAFLAVWSISVRSIPAARKKQSFWKDAAEGFVFVVRNGPILYTNLALLLSVTGTTLFLTILIFHLKAENGLAVREIGLILSCGGAGAIGGSLLAGVLKKRFSYRNLLFGSCLTGGLSIVLLGLAEDFVWLLVLNTIGTAAAAIMNPCIAAIRQQVTPDELMGRVQATSRLMTWALMPASAFMAGILAETAGTSAVIMAGGCFSILGSFFYLKIKGV